MGKLNSNINAKSTNKNLKTTQVKNPHNKERSYKKETYSSPFKHPTRSVREAFKSKLQMAKSYQMFNYRFDGSLDSTTRMFLIDYKVRANDATNEVLHVLYDLKLFPDEKVADWLESSLEGKEFSQAQGLTRADFEIAFKLLTQTKNVHKAKAEFRKLYQDEEFEFSLDDTKMKYTTDQSKIVETSASILEVLGLKLENDAEQQ